MPCRTDGAWACGWCHDLFGCDERDDVETEDEPTNEVEATAIALACAASTPLWDIKVVMPIHHYSNHFRMASSALADKALDRGHHEPGRRWYAEAEALIRTGEVKPR